MKISLPSINIRSKVIFHAWNVTGSHDKLIIGNPMVSEEGLETSKLEWSYSKDLKKIGIGWDEVQEAVEDRRSWWIRVAQRVFDAGRTRNQVKGQGCKVTQCKNILKAIEPKLLKLQSPNVPQG